MPRSPFRKVKVKAKRVIVPTVLNNVWTVPPSGGIWYRMLDNGMPLHSSRRVNDVVVNVSYFTCSTEHLASGEGYSASIKSLDGLKYYLVRDLHNGNPLRSKDMTSAEDEAMDLLRNMTELKEINFT